jgi:diaminohydroxyphosphoribosylaminopyrimidine deaminase/5-amino-6-(5-phosphoribosylamino)uracil reductase
VFLHDAHWMRRALLLARERAGATWPNPTVGACVVHRGRLLGEGAHAGAGHPHAEMVAMAELRRWGVEPGELTVYVTLEPCHHQGRTPPCSRALAAMGVGRVVYAVEDTHVPARGGGAWLRTQGVRVERGPLRREAWELNHPFFETAGRPEPHVTLKLALSLDGKLARRAGRVADAPQRQVTGPIAHRRVHRMRAQASCVVVGRGTVEADAPRLTVRHVPSRRQPRAVVLDTHATLAPTQLPPSTLLLCGPDADESKLAVLREAGHEPQVCPRSAAGELAWSSVLEALTRRGLGVVLVEGGEAVARTALASGVVHRLHLMVAPRIFGGEGPAAPLELLETGAFQRHRLRAVGPDVEWVLRRATLPPPVS